MHKYATAMLVLKKIKHLVDESTLEERNQAPVGTMSQTKVKLMVAGIQFRTTIVVGIVTTTKLPVQVEIPVHLVEGLFQLRSWAITGH